ncbi:membrane protein [Streptomyces sp. NRRL S-237]|uniref:membrane protein n=1 Tax=Streptomyces sp. NRRL S-237 TaxID=1463895 RepID=UPI0004C665D4|nr:membrane protein [Streptomyces sp. NRRL S-237]
MPGSARRSALGVGAAAAVVQIAVVLSASPAAAAPDPTAPAPTTTNDPCALIAGPAREYCERGNGGATGGAPGLAPTDPADALNPLASLARGCADAASWIVTKLSEAVKGSAEVDFTNPAFLKQYSVVFAASTILTLVLWLFAVAKRAVRGVPLTTAMSEAIGFLWLTVLASAFTPLVLYTVVSATDGVTEVIASATGGQTDVFFGSFSEALKKGDDIGGGPIMLIVVALVTVLAAGVLYLELFIRAALLYVGALLGVVVYSGLVDRNLWGHVRRWAGIMIAVILVKPVIVIVLGLAGALTGEKGPNAFSAVVTGLAIILLAIFASAMIYRFVPGFGDEIASARSNRSKATDGAQAAAVISSPASLVSQGIKTHSSRGAHRGDGGSSGNNAPRPANPISGGVAAHSSRPTSGGGAGGGGSVPSAAPPPRTSSSTRNTGGDGR